MYECVCVIERQTSCAELKAACFCLGQSIKMLNRTTLHCPSDLRRACLSASLWVSQTCLTQQPLSTLSSYCLQTVSAVYEQLFRHRLYGYNSVYIRHSTALCTGSRKHAYRQNINHPISYQNKTRDFINTTITQVERKAKNLPNKGSPILLPLRDILPSYF